MSNSTAPGAHRPTEDHRDHDHQDQDQRPHACESGIVYIGHLVVGEDGEEVKVVEAVPCRRCQLEREQEEAGS